jgi:cyclic pyranopterin phosphate synthase
VGLHRLTPDAPLEDTLARPLRDLRISVTDRCNFRCNYCMPAELFGERYEFLPRSEILSFEEIERLARLLVGLGARKLRVTGGEPLLRADLPRLIERLAAIPGAPDLALTTNGVLLPQLAPALRAAGLRRVSVSLDSVDPEVFLRMNGGKLAVERVLEGIAAAERAGLAPLKINCVVQRGVNDHTVVELARRFRGSGHVVRFIEYMDVGSRNGWELAQVVPAEELSRRLDEALGIEPLERSYPGEVAERWRYRDGSGELGIIASVTRPFCRDCTRARLTTDGKLVTCLFATGGTDLRGPLRAGASDEELRALVARVWRLRGDRYSELRAEATGPLRSGSRKIEMYQLGG